MKNQSLHLFLLGGFSLLLLLSFCFTFQGFKQNSAGVNPAMHPDLHGDGSEYHISDSVRPSDDSCIEFTRLDKSLCGGDSVKSLNKTVVKVSPIRTPSFKAVESDRPLRSSALNISLDSYTVERLANACPEGCCTEGYILTVETFSAMIERIRQKSFGPDTFGDPSAAYSDGEEKQHSRPSLKERIRKARETA